MDLFSKGTTRRQYITVLGLLKRCTRRQYITVPGLSKRYTRLSSAKPLNQNEQDQYGKNKLKIRFKLA